MPWEGFLFEKQVARRYRNTSTAILIDQGGMEQCSESRKQLIRRFAAAAVLAGT